MRRKNTGQDNTHIPKDVDDVKTIAFKLKKDLLLFFKSKFNIIFKDIYLVSTI